MYEPITKPEQRRRDPAYVAWIKTQPCMWRHLGPCDGVIEADHGGRRGLSRKSHDDQAVPACQHHHYERTNRLGLPGPFGSLAPGQMRRELDAAIAFHQARYRAAQAAPAIPF